MYRLLGDIVIDTDELIETLAQNQIRVAENVTNATKRDDAVGLRIYVPLKELGADAKSFDENEMEDLMQKAEKLYSEKLRPLLPEELSFKLYAYFYDEVESAIVLNFVMMEWEIARRKLDDVLKRLFDV